MKRKHHHCRCCCPKIIVVPFVPRRRKRRIRRSGAAADINQSTSVNGAMSGLINIVIQVPINAGDATALNKSDNNAVTNVV